MMHRFTPWMTFIDEQMNETVEIGVKDGALMRSNNSFSWNISL